MQSHQGQCYLSRDLPTLAAGRLKFSRTLGPTKMKMNGLRPSSGQITSVQLGVVQNGFSLGSKNRKP
jgi:hypothetical protein